MPSKPKNFFRKLSIKHKLIAIMMLTSGVVLVIASIAFIIKDVIMFTHGVHKNLSSLTRVIGLNSTSALVFNDPAAAQENLESLRAMPFVQSALIFDKNGEVFSAYFRDPTSSKVPPKFIESGHFFDSDSLYIFEPIIFEGEKIGTVFLQYDSSEMILQMKHTGWIFVGIMIFGFILSLIVSNKLQQIISKPILYLADTAKCISQKRDCSVRVEQCDLYQDEIGVLFNGFNEMLAEIQARECEIRAHRENELKMHQEFLDA